MPRYKDAIEWIIYNDDTHFLSDADPALSVAASLVADLFGKDDATVLADLRAAEFRYRNRNRENVERLDPDAAARVARLEASDRFTKPLKIGDGQ